MLIVNSVSFLATVVTVVKRILHYRRAELLTSLSCIFDLMVKNTAWEL